MGHKATLPLLLLLLLARQTSSQESSGRPRKAGDDKDPVAIVELGAATSWNFSGGAATFAPNLAAEVTPIENWLELEAGVSPFYTHKSTEWDTDLLFKKPWTISRKAEFMLGIGLACPVICTNEIVSVAQLLKGPVFLYQRQC
jgi:hypothetical protein